MIRRDNIKKILEIKPRNDIYNFIKSNPGFHFREISRSLNMPSSTLKYHLNYLERKGFLSKQSEKGYLRYYASEKVSSNDKKLLNLLREPVPRNIILYLLLYLQSSQSDILNFAKKWKNHPSKIGFHLNKHRTTIGFHLKKLLKDDVLYSVNKGPEVIYRINDVDAILDIIIRYDKSVLADAYGRFLLHIKDSQKTSIEIDNFMDIFNEIFPPPFCA